MSVKTNVESAIVEMNNVITSVRQILANVETIAAKIKDYGLRLRSLESKIGPLESEIEVAFLTSEVREKERRHVLEVVRQGMIRLRDLQSIEEKNSMKWLSQVPVLRDTYSRIDPGPVITPTEASTLLRLRDEYEGMIQRLETFPTMDNASYFRSVHKS